MPNPFETTETFSNPEVIVKNTSLIPHGQFIVVKSVNNPPQVHSFTERRTNSPPSPERTTRSGTVAENTAVQNLLPRQRHKLASHRQLRPASSSNTLHSSPERLVQRRRRRVIQRIQRDMLHEVLHSLSPVHEIHASSSGRSSYSLTTPSLESIVRQYRSLPSRPNRSSRISICARPPKIASIPTDDPSLFPELLIDSYRQIQRHRRKEPPKSKTDSDTEEDSLWDAFEKARKLK
jgi:hypothetical protein